MKNFAKTTLLTLSMVFSASAAFADPPRPSHDHWRNTGYQGHYVLYDFASHTYVETVNCRATNRFTLVSNQLNELTLFDASRGMTMRLNYDGMWLKAAGASDFTFYQSGTFDTRTQFHHDAGAITKGHGCTWVEWFNGAAGPAYNFAERGTTPGSVELYDGTRDIWVRLDAAQMWLHFGAAAYTFFKTGHW